MVAVLQERRAHNRAQELLHRVCRCRATEWRLPRLAASAAYRHERGGRSNRWRQLRLMAESEEQNSAELQEEAV